MAQELDLKSERRIYEAGIRPSVEIGLALITRLEQAEQAVARVREVCEHFWPKALHQSVPLGVADSQSQIITSELLRALDGDGRG